jgi:MFS family permease
MLDLRFFRNPRFSAAGAAVTLVNFAFVGTLFLLTQFLQFVLGYTPLQAGIRMLPTVIGIMVMAPLSARLVARFGTKLVVVTGMTIGAAGFAVMATVTTASGSATNDTTIELGGALGVAVLGSVLVSGYAAQMTGVVRGLPAAAAAARNNLGDALTAAGQLGGSAGEGLAATARAAFIHGLAVAELVGLAVALAGAVVALAFLPARARPHPPELPPMCDPALNPSCARPLAGLSFLGRRPQPSSSEHNTNG